MTISVIAPQVMQDGRTIPTDEVHQLILELAALRPGDKVLEVGSGSGTTASVLQYGLCSCVCCSKDAHCNSPELCTRQIEVHSVELEPIYQETLSLNPEEVYFHKGDGKLGLAHEAPFDVIVATCGISRVPEAWDQQLAEGGRLVCPLGDPAAQRLVLAVKEAGVTKLRRVRAYVRFSMMR